MTAAIHEAWHEVVKVFAEQNMNTAVTAAYNQVVGSGDPSVGQAPGGSPGPQLGMKATFYLLHSKAISYAKDHFGGDVLVNARSVAIRQEAAQAAGGVRRADGACPVVASTSGQRS